MLTINALSLANQVLVPVQCEFFALTGVSYLAETCKSIRKSMNPSLEDEKFILTMYDARNNLTASIENELRTHFKNVYKTVIPKSVTVSYAQSHSMPLILYDRHSKVGESYINLTKEFLNIA
jgi:chromosome partitioning protein